MKSWKFNFSCCHPIHNLELFLTSSKKPSGFYSNCPNPLLPLFDEKCPGAFKGFHPHEVQLQIPHPAPEHLLKANYFMASNKQLQLLILTHSEGATFHPSHLWFPEHYPKSPWQFSDLSQLLACPRTGIALLCAPAASFAVIVGPNWRALLSIQGVHCVKGQLRQSLCCLAGNEGGVAIWVIVWGWPE